MAGIAPISRSRPAPGLPASSGRERALRAPGRLPGAGARPGRRRRTSRRRCSSSSSASSRSPRRRGCGASATAASARPGSSSSARRRSASPPLRRRARRPRRARARRGSARPAGRAARPMNSSTTLPSLKAFTAGMLWMRMLGATRGLASVSTLASATLPSRLVTAFSSTGVSWRQGPHQSAQKSTTTGSSRERSTTSRWKVCIGGVEDHACEDRPHCDSAMAEIVVEAGGVSSPARRPARGRPSSCCTG